VFRQQHLVGEDAARFADPGGVERLEPFFDQSPDLGAAAGPVVTDGFAC
jgi:hypothetical protein